MQGKTELTKFLGDLVAFQTVSSEAHPTEDCFDYLEKYLNDAGMHVTRFSINQYPSLIATTQKTKKPKVLLQAHIDVVPAIESHFNLEKQDAKLYGRGVYDMKFAAACYMQIISELKNDLDKYDFGIMFTSDEELGGQDGVSALLEQGYDADVCVLPDGGDNWEIETACKGVWITRAYTTGKSAHGSRPWEGESAIERLISALQDVRKLFGEQRADSNTLSISKISGGSAMNQVADKAEATLDIRYTSDKECELLQKKLEKISKFHQVSFDTILQIGVTSTDTAEPHIAAFLKLAAKLRGKELGETKSLGSSDARFFHAKNIPTIVIRPTGGGAHSNREWIDLADLELFYELLKKYLELQAKN